MKTVLELLQSQLDHYIKLKSGNFIGSDTAMVSYAKAMADQYQSAIHILTGTDVKLREGCYECGKHNLKPTEYKCLDCGHNGYL